MARGTKKKVKNKDDVSTLLEFLLKELKNRDADDVVLLFARGESQQLKFSNSKISTTKNWDLSTLLVFATFNKRIVVTTVKDLSKGSLTRAAVQLSQFARHLAPNKEYGGIAKGPFKYPEIRQGFDKKLADYDYAEEHALSIVDSVISTAKRKGIRRVAGVYESGTGSVSLLTSGGVCESERSTSAYLSVRALKSKNASGHMVACSRMLNKLDVSGTVEMATDIALKAAGGAKHLKAGKYNIVFDCLPFANILDHIGMACSIFYVEAGLSSFKNQLGEQVASQLVNVYDHGTLANGISSCRFDEEGVPCQKTTLIKRGVLKNFLHNTSTAKKYKVKTTGSAGLIVPSASNLVLTKGKHSLDELFGHIRNGVYITNLWYTRFNNYTTGDFSTIPRDGIFLIKNGKLSHPIKGIRVSDNLLRIMKAVSAIGKDSKQIRGWEVETPTVTPPVAVNDVPLTKPQ